MIVKKPIGAVKINNIVSRLTIGKPVPANVLEYWKKTNQYEKLKKAGIIGDPDKTDKPEKQETKKEESSKNNDFIRQT